MQKQGYRHSTVKYCIQSLKSVARKANLLHPEAIKSYLASAQCSESRKAKLTEHLARFYTHKGVPFDKPNYKRIERLPFIPLETEVDQLISSYRKKIATVLQNTAERKEERVHNRNHTPPRRPPLYNKEGDRKNRVSNRRRECALPKSIRKEWVQAGRGIEETILQQRAVQK
jgi:hypothetical protein